MAGKVSLGLTAAALSAVLLTLAFPPHNRGLLILVAFVPMLAAQYALLPPRYSALAPVIAIGGWFGVLLVPIFGRGNPMVSTAIPVAIGGLSWFMNRNQRTFHEATGHRWLALEGTFGWVGFEMIRSLIPAIGTWGFVGYSLWQYPEVLQPLSVFGIFGLDLLIMLSNYSLALGLLFILGRRAGTVVDARWHVVGLPSRSRWSSAGQD